MFGKTVRTAPPIGGNYMLDIPGTAQGNWFSPGKYLSNSTDLSSALGLARDYVDPKQPIMAVGTTIQGMTTSLYSFTVEQTGLINWDFGEVKPDERIYCYDNFLSGQSTGSLPLVKPNGIFLLSMPTDKTLKAELVTGTSCSAARNLAFTSTAATFER